MKIELMGSGRRPASCRERPLARGRPHSKLLHSGLPDRLRRFALPATAVLSLTALAAAAQPLVVHEWGTFTSLQDETGRTLAGINSDDEPVPLFCHDLHGRLIQGRDALPPAVGKGAPRCHPGVTMRLETPVVYFHPPPGASLPMTVSVKVAFRGGWLTQFYPAAEAAGFSFAAPLTGASRGTLAWNRLRVGPGGPGPETSDRVWTAPRAVQAATVTATNRESEKFLFYRGVGHLLCPLQVSRTADSATLEGRSQADCGALGAGLILEPIWLAAFRADGSCAFRPLPAVTLEGSPSPANRPPLFSTPAAFPDADYAPGNVAKLRDRMRRALQKEGLFADEADALLNTWEASYFKTPGLRVFFLVPRAWTDFYLPLEISTPCETRRVMVGRLELVTPEQRRRLRELAQGPAPAKNWAFVSRDGQPRFSGEMPRAYRELGRFRNALLLDEDRARPTPALDAFIKVNGLQAFAAADP